MLLFIVFLIAAALAYFGVALAPKLRIGGGPRPEGLAFTLAVLLVATAGLISFYVNQPHGLLEAGATTPEQVMARPLIPPGLLSGLQIFLLAGAVYFLSAIRGLAGFPAWVADAIVIVAALLAVRSEPSIILQPVTSSHSDAGSIYLGILAIPLTVLWILAVSRLAASLNRAPQVAGPYLGMVSLTLLWLSQPSPEMFFPTVVSAAIGGAGLAMLPFALKRPSFNLGWSATLAIGFLLGCVSALGLLRHTMLAIVALALLAFGLPLLDVTFFRIRARLRGQDIEWEQRRERLHEALIRRGISPVKVGLLYFCLGVWLCLLALLLTHWLFSASAIALRLFFLLLFFFLAALGSIVFISLARVLMRRAPGEDIPESIDAFGVKITPVTMVEALDKIEEFVQSRRPHHVVTSDANAILRSREDEEYAGIIRRAALITPDGFGVIWGARLLNLPIYERVTGVDMVTGICERAAKNNYGIYILGSEPGVAATAAQKLAQKYPGLRVVGTQHGFYGKDGRTDEEIAEQIRDAKPDVLFVAFGIPKQEKFIAGHLETMNVPVCLGVGGSFDVYSGKYNRAPVGIQRAGLEWLYRVWIDPSRWKRMGYVPRFVLVALRTWIFTGRRGQDAF